MSISQRRPDAIIGSSSDSPARHGRSEFPRGGTSRAALGVRILWVDDRPREIGGLVECLRSAGCVIDLVQTSEAAIEAVHRREHDLVILDWILNGRDASVVLNQCRSHGIDTPIMVLTGHRTAYLEKHSAALGLVRVRQKPIHGEDLLNLICADARRPESLSYSWLWTRRTRLLLDAQRSALNSSSALEPDQRVDVLARLGRSLADRDAAIPEVVAGIRTFALLHRAPSWRWRRHTVAEALQTIEWAVFDSRALHAAVTCVVKAFEEWTAARALPTEAELAGAVRPAISRSRLSELINSSTRLNAVEWKRGARLRRSVRALVEEAGAMKQIAPESGWSSVEQFSREFKGALGIAPSAFRALVSHSPVDGGPVTPTFDAGKSTKRPSRRSC